MLVYLMYIHVYNYGTSPHALLIKSKVKLTCPSLNPKKRDYKFETHTGHDNGAFLFINIAWLASHIYTCVYIITTPMRVYYDINVQIIMVITKYKKFLKGSCLKLHTFKSFELCMI